LAPIWPLQILYKWSDGSKTSALRVTTRASLARFTGSQLRLTRRRTLGERTRDPEHPRSSAPALQRTRVAVATGNVGHIQTGVYVACFNDHKMRRTTTLRESTTGFGLLQSGTLVEGPTGRGGPAATCGVSNPRPVDLSTCAAY
jgi:hypothetical protein